MGRVSVQPARSTFSLGSTAIHVPLCRTFRLMEHTEMHMGMQATAHSRSRAREFPSALKCMQVQLKAETRSWELKVESDFI